MREVTLVDSQEAFGRDGLVEAVEDALVEVSGLVVHSGHDRVCEFQRVSCWPCYLLCERIELYNS